MPSYSTPRRTTIYALLDPRDQAVRYVGKTVRPLAVRLREHLQNRQRLRTTYLARWLQSLVTLGLRPAILVLEEVDEDWTQAERRWIEHYRQLGARLTNLTDGGEGTNGYVQTESAKERIAAFWRGRGRGPAIAQKISMTLTGRTLSEKHRSRISEGILKSEKAQRQRKQRAGFRRGQHNSPEHRARQSAAAKNRSPEYRAMLAERMRHRWTDPIFRAMMTKQRGKRGQEESTTAGG